MPDIVRLDALIDADPAIPNWVKEKKRELLRATFWMGDTLIQNKGYTESDVKVIGRQFVLANILTSDVWKAAEEKEKTFEAKS